MSDINTDPRITFKDALADLEEPPYCTGIVPLDGNNSTLFYRAGNSPYARILNFNGATDEQLSALAQSCQPASFGVAREDVLDESYRKAGKMECADFATQFSPFSAKIVDKIRGSLFQGRNETSIDVEMYKLNVYGPGSFFKSHIDTPRSDVMFGSLVVILPTKHEGGSLLFRHLGREFTFDSAEAVVTDPDNLKAAFVAFWSDVEHEVSVVTSGYRVTLTYNLYFSETRELTPIPPSSPLTENAEDRMKSALEALMNDPEFLPDGGFLGFGLLHKYPFKKSTDLSVLERKLKGTDALVKQIWDEVFPDIELDLKAIYKEDEVSCLVDQFAEMGDLGEVGLLDYIVDQYEGELVYTPATAEEEEKKGELDEFLEEYPGARLIDWVTPLNEVNEIKEPYIVAFGNGPELDYAYGKVCLVAEIGSAEKRGLAAAPAT